MKNLNFLGAGQIFPPLEEAKRIGAIVDYDLMFDGNTHAVEENHFKQTLRNLNKIAVMLGWTGSYISVEYNYFQLTSIKTADFVCGEIPDILSNAEDDSLRKRQPETIDEIRAFTIHDTKFYDGVTDVSKYGESYLRVYPHKTESRNTYTLQSPAMIITVTDEEDDYEVTNYVVSWFNDVHTVLHVQIHYRGYYIKRDYKIREAVSHDLSKQRRYEEADTVNDKRDLYLLLNDRTTDEIFRCKPYVIESQIGADQLVETHLDDFAIIRLSNIKNSSRHHGMSDYDRIDSIVASIQRTVTQVQLIFDKYTTPTMAVPIEALAAEGGEHVMQIGKAVGVPEGGIIPQFLEPDLSKLEYYFRQLEFNVDRIKELSEMGAALSSETNVSNISTETMKAQFASATKKAERLSTRNTDAVKKLFHLLSMYGYKEVIPEENISITWYDGLPNDEEKDVRVATMKVQSGLSNRREEYKNRFNHTDAEFDKMWDDYLEEQSDLNTVSAVGNMFNPFNPSNLPDSAKEDSGDGADGNGDKTAQKPHNESVADEHTAEDGEG